MQPTRLCIISISLQLNGLVLLGEIYLPSFPHRSLFEGYFLTRRPFHRFVFLLRGFISRIAELMEENQELLDQMKKEAEDAVQLLAPLVERRREEEIKSDGSSLFSHTHTLSLFFPFLTFSPPLPSSPSFAGLIIVDAQYGALSNFSSRGLGLGLKRTTTPPSSKANPDHIDVKIALQALVNDSQLIIPAGRSKAGLLGFYDCALGSKKR